MEVLIRDEIAEDVHAIHTLTRSAFLDQAHSSHTEQFIVDALREADALTLSLVAERDAVIIGHVAISPVTISDGSRDWYGLGPISVRPADQGQGIGSLLMEMVLKRLKAQNTAGCVLLGNPDFYRRFGFIAMENLVLADVPPAYFQALLFKNLPASGMVEYHTAFSATG